MTRDEALREVVACLRAWVKFGSAHSESELVVSCDALLAELDRTAKVELIDIEGPPTRVGEITTEELAHLRECKRAIEEIHEVLASCLECPTRACPICTEKAEIAARIAAKIREGE